MTWILCKEGVTLDWCEPKLDWSNKF